MCWDSFPCQQMRTLVWKLRMAKESHCIPLVSGSTFVIFRHHSWFPRLLFLCILTISTLFNNWKYFIFTDEWNIFSFSGAYILSTWIHDTHTLIVLSYKSPWAWQFPHITVCFKGPQCLLLVLTHCSSSLSLIHKLTLIFFLSTKAASWQSQIWALILGQECFNDFPSQKFLLILP